MNFSKAACAVVLALAMAVPVAVGGDGSGNRTLGTTNELTAMPGSVPTIDGQVSLGEWTDADASGLPSATLFTKHDGMFAYFCALSTTDTNATAEPQQSCSFIWDMANNKGTMPQTDDRRFTAIYDVGWMYEYFRGNVTMWETATVPAGASMSAGYDSGEGCWVYECALPLATLDASGSFLSGASTIGFGCFVATDGTGASASWPTTVTGVDDPSEWGSLYYFASSDAEPNDTITAATMISPGTLAGLLHAGDPSDYFSVVLDEPGMTVFLNVTVGPEMTVNAYIYWYDGVSTSPVASWPSITDSTARLAYCFETPQTAYLRIQPSIGAGYYQMQVGVMSQNDIGSGSDAGNDYTTASAVGPGPHPGNYLRDEDSYDYYEITLVEPGMTAYANVTVGMDVTVDLSLFTFDHYEVGSAPFVTDGVGRVRYCFETPQTVFVRVHLNAGYGRYQLDIGVVGQDDAFNGTDAGNSYDTATLVGPGLYPQNRLMDDDSMDFYRVVLTEAGQTLRVAVIVNASLTVSIDMFTFDHYPVASAPAINAGTGEAIYCFETAQNTFVKVTLNGGRGIYGMYISVASQDDGGTGSDAGNIFDEATTLLPGIYNNCSLRDDDWRDYFRVSLTLPSQTLRVIVTASESIIVDVYLYDSARYETASAISINNAATVIDYCFSSAQSVYLLVQLNGGYGSYDVSIAVLTQDDAGTGGDAPDDFISALSVSPGTFPDNWLEDDDYNDYYKITVPAGVTLYANFSLNASLTMAAYLIDQYQTWITYETLMSDTAFTLTHTATDEETVRILAQLADGGGAYSLEIALAGAAPAVLPSEPLALTALEGDEEVTLTWNVPATSGGSPIESYRLYRGLNDTGLVPLTSSYTTTYEDIGLTNGVTYYYAVAAVNTVGEGPLSDTVSATPVAGNLPPALPSSPYPANGAFVTGPNITLSVLVGDFDTDGLFVYFFYYSWDLNASSLVGFIIAGNGDRANITWTGLDEGITYSWYATVYDGSSMVTSDRWNFTTRSATEPAMLVIWHEGESLLYSNQTVNGEAMVLDSDEALIGPVAAIWTVENSDGAEANTAPEEGYASVFSAGSEGGRAVWTATWGNLTASVNFTIVKRAVAVIGEDGGTVELDGATLVIPAGALTENVTISISVLPEDDEAFQHLDENQTLVGSAHEFGPDGTQFSVAVTLTLPYDSSMVDDNGTVSVFLWNDASQEWIRLEGCVVDETAGTVSVNVTHFSRYAVLATESETATDEKDDGGDDDGGGAGICLYFGIALAVIIILAVILLGAGLTVTVAFGKGKGEKGQEP